MARLGKSEVRSGRRVAVIEDDPILLESTLALLAHEGSAQPTLPLQS